MAAAALVALGRPVRADAPSDTTIEAAISFGYVPTSTHVSAAGVAASATASAPGLAPTPFATGSDDLGTSGFAVSAHATALTPYYGPGIFRAFFLLGGTVFFGRSGSSTFGTFHGPSPDTGASANSTFAIDAALGGDFPLCAGLACADLRAFFGLSMVRQGITAWSDETGAGGKREETSATNLKWGTVWGLTLTKPLCSDCSSTSLRLLVGLMVRAVPATTLTFASATGRAYSVYFDPQFEPQIHAGLLLPIL